MNFSQSTDNGDTSMKLHVNTFKALSTKVDLWTQGGC